MYYPKSQITTNLYTNGDEYVIKKTGENYIGFYWKYSSGKLFTGKTPQDLPIQELIISPILSTGKSDQTNDTLQVALPRFDVDPEGLDVYVEEGIYNASSIQLYTSLKNIDTNIEVLIPYYSPTLPTSQDYQIGEMRRFFCKKINEISYLEISKEIYDKLINKNSTIAFQYYKAFNIPWQLTGDKEQVFKTNRNIVELTIKQQNLPKFDLYLKKDYTKYYK